MDECALCGAPGAACPSPANNAMYCNEKCEAADNPDWEPEQITNGNAIGR